MSVNKLMTPRVEQCAPETDLAAVAMAMWRADCGVVPVVEANSGRLVGIITDRDICMAAATKHCPIYCIPVEDVMARTVVTCRPNDSARTALARMAEHRVRRLPVVDGEGRPVGMLSITDVVRAAGAAGREPAAAVDASEVLATIHAIGQARADRESIRSRAVGRRRTAARSAAGARAGAE